jgi:hypothetical protein
VTEWTKPTSSGKLGSTTWPTSSRSFDARRSRTWAYATRIDSGPSRGFGSGNELAWRRRLGHHQAAQRPSPLAGLAFVGVRMVGLVNHAEADSWPSRIGPYRTYPPSFPECGPRRTMISGLRRRGVGRADHAIRDPNIP